MQNGKIKPRYKYCSTHIILNIKMDKNIMRKARLFSGGHKTDVPSSITYLSVVSRDNVTINDLIESLNYQDICA